MSIRNRATTSESATPEPTSRPIPADPPSAPHYFCISNCLPEILDCNFWVGVAKPQFWGRGGRRGAGMVPFERGLVSFYRPSIVTFPLSLRILEILPLLFFSMPLFPYPTSSLPKISPYSPGSRWIAFWLQRAKVLR